jgi:hypothetical protein
VTKDPIDVHRVLLDGALINSATVLEVDAQLSEQELIEALVEAVRAGQWERARELAERLLAGGDAR